MPDPQNPELLQTWESLYGERTLSAIRTDVRHPFDTDAAGCVVDFGDVTVFAFEDPDDGYRSNAVPIFTTQPLYSFGVEPEYIRAPVVVRALKATYSGEADGIEVIDRRNGKTILRLGTDNYDDYYPSFLCEWTPENLGSNSP